MLKRKAGTDMWFLQWKQGQLAQNLRKIMFAGGGLSSCRKLQEIAVVKRGVASLRNDWRNIAITLIYHWGRDR